MSRGGEGVEPPGGGGGVKRETGARALCVVCCFALRCPLIHNHLGSRTSPQAGQESSEGSDGRVHAWAPSEWKGENDGVWVETSLFLHSFFPVAVWERQPFSCPPHPAQRATMVRSIIPPTQSHRPALTPPTSERESAQAEKRAYFFRARHPMLLPSRPCTPIHAPLSPTSLTHHAPTPLIQVLNELGQKITDALARVAGDGGSASGGGVDEAAVDACLKDICTALLQVCDVGR